MISFHDVKLNTKDPVYLQAAMHVKRQILLRQAVTGDKLPSRREIAAQLGINPNTVQKAFKLMEDEGYVRTNSTQGSEIYADAEILERIETELTRDLVKDFIGSAKEIQLPFQKVIQMISELWG
ncbi:GntR family transcriptional regulator [Gorillibacterium massiliense]|uniref:GntR family transcriptional regulator n=1 Tax=Gorillibacterium massiliense TaxID=1280390 RepID=UPI0004BA0A49|nr:GntR family transcriptional regulator [Gorillibacterium massiliense]